jgi:hypothetical protein
MPSVQTGRSVADSSSMKGHGRGGVVASEVSRAFLRPDTNVTRQVFREQVRRSAELRAAAKKKRGN